VAVVDDEEVYYLPCEKGSDASHKIRTTWFRNEGVDGNQF
jgi:hypothetical protein